jgi:hypothetical protein
MIVLFDSFVSSDKATARGLKMKFESIGTGLYDRSSKTSVSVKQKYLKKSINTKKNETK